MGQTVILLAQSFDLSERYRVELKVFEVGISEKYPEGVKASFALIDVIQRKLRLLIDNHAPFGFHVHEGLPENKASRRLLETTNYLGALDEFRKLVKEIVNGEI